MSHRHQADLTKALNTQHASTLHPDISGPAPARVIEIGDVTAGIAVPELGGVRFFSSQRDFDALDGTVFRSVEGAARAARDRFRQVTRRVGRRPSGVRRLQAV